MSRWQLAVEDDENERVVGVFIMFPASEYVLELRDNGLDNRSRREWCDRLCVMLNEARKAGKL
jgi:hypothetical protein